MKHFSPFSSSWRLVRRLVPALTALGLLLAPAGAAQAQTFAPAVTYTTGTIPQDITTVDVNGDGRLDIITANSTSNNVGVLLGSAATPGTFPATATFYGSGGGFPVGLGVGDVNGDGRPDIVVDNQSSNTVSVLLNSAATPGTFLAAVTYGSGTTTPRGLGLIDLNGDGRLDIVAGGSNTIGVLLNSATTPGTFGTALTYATGVTADGIAVGDVNGDGRPDVAVTGYQTANTITVLLNSATTPGTFPTLTAYNSGGVNPRGVTIADVNGDGRADIIAGNETSNTVGVLPNLAATPGTFGPAATYSSGASGPDGVRVRDMNGDLRPDIVATNYNISSGTTVSVLLNSATTLGTFATGTTYSSGGQGPVGLALGDLNSDGRPDIATTNVLSSTVGVLLNTSLFNLPTLTSLNPTSGPVGTSITLTGTNLTGATGVSFNGTAATIFAVVNATTVTATVPTGATTGNVTATTPSGTSNGVAFTVNPPTNNALAFDRPTSNYVALPASTPVPVGNTNYTIEAWIKPTAMGDFGIIGWGNYNANNQVNALRLSATGVINYWWGNDLIRPTASLAGAWHHVAATYDGTTRRLYVDGAPVGSDVPAAGSHAVPNANNLRIGSTNVNTAGNPGGTNEYFPGSIDEVRVYNTGLTQAQIQADMFSTTPAVPGNQVAYYDFNQGIAGGNNAGVTALPNLASTANPGMLTNFALTGTISNWVRSFPTITGISPTSGAAGSSVSVAGTNLTDATGFQFGTGAVTPFTAPTDDFAATFAVPASASTGPVSVSSATLANYNGPVFTFLAGDLVVSTTMTIPPATYNNITVTGPNGNGTLGGDVVVNGALVVQSGGTLADGCNIITGPGTFTLAAGGTLSICRPRGILAVGDPQGNIGTVRVTGGRSFASDASYIYAGADATGSGLPSQVRNLSITVPGDVALSAPTSVAQVLTLGSTGNLVLGGNALTLLSSASGTALVVNSGPGTVVGNATVQRYIDPTLNPGPGYRHYSAPVSNTTVADLMTSGFSPEVSQAATYNASATPGSTTPFPTVFGYDQSRVTLANTYAPFDRGFVVPATTATPLVVGRGYAVNIAGTALVDFVGTLNTGPRTLTLARNAAGTANESEAGWHLVGNPYPAPLDYSLVAPAGRAGLDASMYVYESATQYTGTYRAFVNGLPAANRFVGTAQGFFVRVSAGQTSGTLSFQNSQRVTDPTVQVPFRRTAVDARPLVQLELRNATGAADAFYAYAEAGATPAFDSQFDAVKLANPTGLNLSSTATSGERLAIDGRPVFAAATVLPLAVGVPAAGAYTLTAAALDNLPAGLDAFLSDALTGQTVNLRTQPAYAFTVTASQATALLTNRFTLHFAARTALATASALTAAQVELYPNPAHDQVTVLVPTTAGAAAVQATLLNALGQVVRQRTAPAAAGATRLTLETAGLAAGVYTLRLQVGPTAVAKRLVVQ